MKPLEFMKNIFYYIITSSNLQSRRESVFGDGVPSGSHFIIGHSLSGNNGTPVYEKIRPAGPVTFEDVDGVYYATLLGPIERINTYSTWELEPLAYQVVGRVLGVHPTSGGYSIGSDSDSEDQTITNISPMAFGHVFDKYGYPDAMVENTIEPHLSFPVRSDGTRPLRLGSESQICWNNTCDQVANFQGGSVAANPNLEYQHLDGLYDSVGPIRNFHYLRDNHTTNYTDLTINVIQQIINPDYDEGTPSVSIEDPLEFNVGDTATFNAEYNDPAGQFAWNFDDGTSEITEDPLISHTFDSAGTKEVRAAATNTLRETAFDTIYLVVAPADQQVFVEDFEDGDLSEWSLTTEGEATVAIDNERLRLQVYRCSTAVAEYDLGELNGPVRVSFDWENSAEEWHEHTKWHLLNGDGDPIEYDVVTGSDIPVRPGYRSTNQGAVTVLASIDNDRVGLRYEVIPSPYCQLNDHANTYLWVDNITVVQEPGVPESPTPPGDVTGNGRPAQDLNGDGLYEDVDGDGDLTYNDIVAYFEHFDDNSVRESPMAFDFNRNGGLDYGDIIALYRLV